MTTPLRLLAFHSWEKHMNQTLWVYPINWNTAQKSFYAKITTKTETAKFIFWEFLLFLIGFGCSGFLLARQIMIPSPDISVLNLVILVFFVCGASSACIGSFVLYFDRAYTVLILRELLHMEILLKSGQSKATQPNKLDYLGIIVNTIVGFGLIVPVIFPFFAYLEIDPLGIIFKMTFNENNYKKMSLVLLLTRIGIETYLVLGAIRLIVFVAISSTVYLKVILFCGAQIMKNSNLVRLVKNQYVLIQHTTRYRGFYINIEEINNVFANTGLLVLLSFMLVTTIICMFVIIRMPDVLNIVPIAYISAIGLVFLVIMYIQFQIPYIVALHQMSCGTLFSWKLQSSLLRERKQVDRILKSLRP